MNRTRMIGGAALAATLAVPGIGWAAPAPVQLELVGRTPAQGEAGAEIAAHHAGTQRIYVTNAGANSLDVYDATDPGADPVVIDLSPYGGGPNSVDVSDKRGGIVAVAVQAEDISDDGTVELFDADGTHLASVPAGPLPDMVTFTHDEHHIRVANEGERQSDDDDAPGSGSVIDIRRGPVNVRVRTATLEDAPTRASSAAAPYAFLAAERSGGILAYDLSDVPGEAGFAGYTTTRPDDLGPEGVRFVPAKDSPTGEPLVLVTHEITGTVAVFAVR